MSFLKASRLTIRFDLQPGSSLASLCQRQKNISSSLKILPKLDNSPSKTGISLHAPSIGVPKP
eukprot:164690-Pelagomonas_calceolata.AAC.1